MKIIAKLSLKITKKELGKAEKARKEKRRKYNDLCTVKSTEDVLYIRIALLL